VVRGVRAKAKATKAVRGFFGRDVVFFLRVFVRGHLHGIITDKGLVHISSLFRGAAGLPHDNDAALRMRAPTFLVAWSELRVLEHLQGDPNKISTTCTSSTRQKPVCKRSGKIFDFITSMMS
jgi:hypothetical protein